MKRFLSFCFVFFAGFCCVHTLAEPRFGGGNGTYSDPWLINSIADLNQLAADCNAGNTIDEVTGNRQFVEKYFKLTADLDYSSQPVVNGSNFTPIGFTGYLGDQDLTIFAGWFDGGGHTIRGIKVNRTENDNGIFGALARGGYVKNLTLAASTITGGLYTGGIVGRNNGGSIINCHILSDVTIGAAIDNTSFVGGITGYMWGNIHGYAVVEGCTCSATITTNGKKGCNDIGGIAGYLANASSSLSNCFFMGNMADCTDRTAHVGAVLGLRIIANDVAYGTLEKCYYTTQANNLGGLDWDETPGTLEAELVEEKNDEFGYQIKQYDSYDGIPALTVWQWGVAYDGKYYLYGGNDPFPLYEDENGYYTKPYKIKTAEDLRKLAKAVNYRRDYYKKYFSIEADINLGGGEETNFQPIGGVDKPFNGVIYGKEHTISGMVINREETHKSDQYIGLIGNASGYCRVEDLKLADSRITGYHYTGGIVGFGNTLLNVTNCHVLSNVTITALPGATAIGGIAGSGGCFSACTSAATINATAEGCSRIGGIAGSMEEFKVFHCICMGPVNTGNNEHTGAILGWKGSNMEFSTNLYAKECIVRGIDGSETPDANMFTHATTEYPDGAYIGDKVTEYKDRLGNIVMVAYKKALLYGGKYYYSTNSPRGHFPLYAGDEGTVENPCRIKTTDDMNLFAQDVSYGCSFAGIHFCLTDNLDFGGGTATNYLPAGNKDSHFQGSFDGQGHSISGITIKRKNNERYTGVFGAIDEGAIVCNLTVASSSFSGHMYTAPVVGYVYGGTIENCHVLSTVTVDRLRDASYSSSYGQYVGGIAGWNAGHIRGCTSAASIFKVLNSGGIVGYQEKGSVTDCINLADFSGEQPRVSRVGGVFGFVGSDDGEVSSELQNNYYTEANQTGGQNEKDGPGARQAKSTASAPEGLGAQKCQYTAFEGMPVVTAYADGLYYDGLYYHSQRPATFFPIYEGDEGTEEKPFRMKSKADWQKLVDDVLFTVTFKDKFFALDADIDFGGGDEANCQPVGMYGYPDDYPFKGCLDGKGHTLRGIVIKPVDESNLDYDGIFGKLKGAVTIKNLTVAGCHITGRSYVGAILGQGEKGVSIVNCHVLDDVVIDSYNDWPSQHGGIAGYMVGSSIMGCTSAAKITKFYSNCGGIVGQASSSTLTDCLFLGNLPSREQDSENTLGGIAGSMYTYSSAEVNTVNRCYYFTPGNSVPACGDKNISGAYEASVLSTLPSTAGMPISAYAQFENAPAMKVYDGGIAYDGRFYTSLPLTTLLGTIADETTIDTSGLEGKDLSCGLVDGVYYQLPADGGNGYDVDDQTIVIAQPTDMGAIDDATPGSEDMSEAFTGLVFRVTAGTGSITLSVRTSGQVLLAVKIGNKEPLLTSQNEKGNITVHYDELEDTYIYVYAVSPSASRGSMKAPAQGSVELSQLTVMPEGPVATAAQTLALTAGNWQWISTGLRQPADIAPLAAKARRIMSQTHELVFDDIYGMVGNISMLEPGQAYKVQASVTGNVTLPEGPVYTYEAELKLKKGWNWVAYPYSKPATLESVLANAGNGDYIAGYDGGFAQYDGQTWEGSLCLKGLTPGSGYLYKSVGDKGLKLDFTHVSTPSLGGGRGRLPAGSRADMPSAVAANPSAGRYPNTMNITARISDGGTQLSGDNYRLLAYDDEGELRGQSVFVGENHYLTVYGEAAVGLTFRVENTQTGLVYPVVETLCFENDAVGSRENPLLFTIGTPTGIIQATPVEQNVTVYTLGGVLLHRHATQADLRNLPKGTYIVNGRVVER